MVHLWDASICTSTVIVDPIMVCHHLASGQVVLVRGRFGIFGVQGPFWPVPKLEQVITDRAHPIKSVIKYDRAVLFSFCCSTVHLLLSSSIPLQNRSTDTPTLPFRWIPCYQWYFSCGWITGNDWLVFEYFYITLFLKCSQPSSTPEKCITVVCITIIQDGYLSVSV